MGQIVVNVGSFDKYSYNGVTAYGTSVHFNIPENAGITGCSVSFVTHGGGGNTADRAFALNGVRAHSSGSWAQAGALTHTLLSAGDNIFRVTLKSTTPGGYTVCWWDISNITLTINFNDIGGGGTPPPNIGAVTINKTTLTAGDTITVSASACDAVFSRSVYLMLADNTVISTIAFNFGTAAGSWTVTVPTSLCETYAADSETLILKAYMDVYQTGSYVGSDAKNFTMQVPASAVPTIGTFTAALNSNGVDASITKYVQNYSKCNLLAGASGALGSGIVLYEIYSGVWYSASHNPTFGPFSQTGDITFTVKATDTRGRAGYGYVTINVLSYGPAAFSSPEAWRSSDVGVKNQKGAYARLFSGVSYSILGGENSVTLKGRVYPKGGAAPAYTSMTPDTPWIAGAGLLLATKTYIAQMIVQDKITSKTMEFTIPTKKTGISIMAGMQGIAFGKVVEIPGVSESAWPIVAPGLAPNPNLLHNWDFRNPVNQRGVSGAISSGTYFFDRWIRNIGTVTVAAGYLTMASGSNIGQPIEGFDLKGETVCVSVKVGTSIYSGTGTFPTSEGSVSITLLGFGTAKIGLGLDYSYLTLIASGIQDVAMVKLELGTVSTLHLDPPMDYGVELAKCQRYFRVIHTQCRYWFDNYFVFYGGHFSPQMRIDPTFINPTLNIGGGGGSKTVVSVACFKDGLHNLQFSPAGDYSALTNVGDFSCWLSSDL